MANDNGYYSVVSKLVHKLSVNRNIGFILHYLFNLSLSVTPGGEVELVALVREL